MQVEEITKELTKWNTTDAAIAIIRKDYMALTIAGLEDHEGLAKVHKARMDVKSRRVAVQKTGKTLREDAVKFQKRVIEEEKRIISLLEPIEDHLSDEENRVEEEKARIKAEADALIAAKIQGRINSLFDLGCRYDGSSYIYGSLVFPQALVKECDDNQFQTFHGAIREAVEKDALQREAEDRARKEEAARLIAMAREQEKKEKDMAAERAKLQAERDAIDAEKKRLAYEEAKKIRAQEIEAAKAEAAEKARKEVENAIKVQAELKAAKEEAARIKAERKAARAPDKIKILLIADTLDSIQTPDVKTEEGKAVALSVMMSITELIKTIRDRANEL